MVKLVQSNFRLTVSERRRLVELACHEKRSMTSMVACLIIRAHDAIKREAKR